MSDPVMNEEQVEWFAWMLVAGRNNWWPPRETADACLEGVAEDDTDAPTSDAVEYERGYHWGMFNASAELVYDFGRALASSQGIEPDETGYQARRAFHIGLTEEYAQRYIDRARSEGSDLDDEITREEIRDEMKRIHEEQRSGSGIDE